MARDMFHGEFDGTHVAKNCPDCNDGIKPAVPMTDAQTLAFAKEILNMGYTLCQGPELKALASMLVRLAGNTDKAATVYSGEYSHCNNCGKTPGEHDGMGRCLVPPKPNYYCRNAICQLTGEHSQVCLKKHEIEKRIDAVGDVEMLNGDEQMGR